MKKSELIKTILKDRKPTFGTDPNDPWSAKANITEDAYLNKYLKSRGINPEFATKDQKVAHSKTGEFKKWKNDHLSDVSIKTEAYVDKRDVVTFDIPFLIRVLEYSREDAKTDMDLHNVVTKLIQIRNKGVLTMKDYSFVTRLKEHFEITDIITEQEIKNPVKKDWEKYAQNRSEIWRRKRLKIDELDVSTLKSYATKARADAEKLSKQGDAASKRSSTKSMQTALDKFRKATKRNMGAASAESKARVKEEVEQVDEDLRKWFSKSHPEGGWKRINSKGEAIGPCAREPGEPKPKCMSNEKRAKLSKSERASAVAAKRKHDPVADRSGKGGKPVNVSNFGKGKLGEEVDQLDEKNKPTNPSLWSRAKSMARSKFDVYPSAYANGWASKWYKSKGGGWKSVKEDKFQDPYAATQTVGSEVDTDVLPTRKREMTKSARMIKSIYKKKRVKEELYDHEKENKGGKYGEKSDAAFVLRGGKTMTGTNRDTIEIDPMMKPRPGKPDPLKR
jgi:hypothetical protein